MIQKGLVIPSVLASISAYFSILYITPHFLPFFIFVIHFLILHARTLERQDLMFRGDGQYDFCIPSVTVYRGFFRFDRTLGMFDKFLFCQSRSIAYHLPVSRLRQDSLGETLGSDMISEGPLPCGSCRAREKQKFTGHILSESPLRLSQKTT